MLLCQVILQAPLLSPHLKFAMKQEHEPEQTLFSGKGQLGNVLVCVRVEMELWISVVLRTQSAHSDCTLSLLLEAPAVSTDESLVTARKAMPCSPPFCFQYSRPGFFCAQRLCSPPLSPFKTLGLIYSWPCQPEFEHFIFQMIISSWD